MAECAHRGSRPGARGPYVALRLVFLLLFAGALALAVHGVRAAVAQSLYYSAKFGAAREDVPLILAHCERAHRLYAPNYYFAMWTAEKAYYGACELRDGDVNELFGAARTWCERGLELNPYRSPLRRLKTRLLRRDSLEDAIAYWDEYVDWNFWNPHHHAVRAELYAAAGKWGAAMRALRWVKGSPYYAEAQEKTNREWRKQLAPPPE